MVNLDIEEAKQRFTVLTIEERIDKIVIVSNNDLIVIDTSGVIYNLGRFNFLNKFKELKETGHSLSLKKDFGKVAVTKLAGLIEQYGNMIFMTDEDL